VRGETTRSAIGQHAGGERDRGGQQAEGRAAHGGRHDDGGGDRRRLSGMRIERSARGTQPYSIGESQHGVRRALHEQHVAGLMGSERRRRIERLPLRDSASKLMPKRVRNLQVGGRTPDKSRVRAHGQFHQRDFRIDGGFAGIIRRVRDAGFPGFRQFVPAILGEQESQSGQDACERPGLGLDHEDIAGLEDPLELGMETRNSPRIMPMTWASEFIKDRADFTQGLADAALLVS
jgi:hypothetical protein